MVSSHCDLTDWYLQTAWGLRAQLDRRVHAYLLLVGIPAPFVRRPGLPNSVGAIPLHARKELSLTRLTVGLRQQALAFVTFSFQVEDMRLPASVMSPVLVPQPRQLPSFLHPFPQHT